MKRQDDDRPIFAIELNNGNVSLSRNRFPYRFTPSTLEEVEALVAAGELFPEGTTEPGIYRAWRGKYENEL